MWTIINPREQWATDIGEFENNKSEIKELQELEEKAKTVFGDSPEKEPDIPVLPSDELLQLESNPILEKKVVGKSDVDIAAMITWLSWVEM